MPEIVQCPQCDRQLRVPDDLLGKKVKCPTCATTFVAETASAPPPPPPPREPDNPLAPPERPSRRRRQRDTEDDGSPLRPPRGPRRDTVPHRGTLVLILGILSIVLFNMGAGLILGPIAWILGSRDLREIREGSMDPAGEGLTRGGMICGIIGTAISVLSCFCCVGYVVLMIAIDEGAF